jgi:hypothetical protein
LCPVVNGTNGDGGGGQMEICHIESGQDPVTIFVHEDDLVSHLAHGDSEGPCPKPNGGEDDDDRRSTAPQSAWSW